MDIVELNGTQVQYLLQVLESEPAQGLMETNAWYSQFIPSIRVDLIRRRSLTLRQLYQIEKIAHMAQMPWRIVV